ncbi:MAG: hypothetical protein IIW92_10620, partial [Lachnospiraceae bacterium]|nr:hypothetical protein [Lachnospiraceae bacterium]
MEDKDEYIASLLLSLFLMQGEIDRLNQTLDLVRKGELVYINKSSMIIPAPPQMAVLIKEVKEDLVKRAWNLQTENKELAHYLACMTEQRNKANTCLQEIKAIADAKCNECKYGK